MIKERFTNRQFTFNKSFVNQYVVKQLAGRFISNEQLYAFNRRLRQMGLPSPPKFIQTYTERLKEAKELLTVSNHQLRDGNKYLVGQFKDEGTLNTYIGRVLNNESISRKISSFGIICDDGLGSSKMILQFNSANYHMQKYIMTGMAKFKESG